MPAASAARTAVELTSGKVIGGRSRRPASLPAGPTTMNGTVRRSSSPPYQLATSRQQIAADHQRERVLGVQLAQAADRAQGQARAAERALHVADPRARAQRRRRQLAHRQPILERDQRLAERVLEGGHEPQLVDRRRLQHVQRGQLVRDVRRVEAPAEQGHAHR